MVRCPDAHQRHVSAVLFTNQGTIAKFTRMAHRAGYTTGLTSVRFGTGFDPDPTSIDPTLFAFDLDAPPFDEEWCHGITLFHNPHALHPLSDGLLSSITEVRMQGGRLLRSIPKHHVYSSKTFHVPKWEHLPLASPIEVFVLPFDHPLRGISLSLPPGVAIDQWFANTRGAVGLLFRDGSYWTSALLRNNTEHSLDYTNKRFSNRNDARALLQRLLLDLAMKTDTIGAVLGGLYEAPAEPRRQISKPQKTGKRKRRKRTKTWGRNK